MSRLYLLLQKAATLEEEKIKLERLLEFHPRDEWKIINARERIEASHYALLSQKTQVLCDLALIRLNAFGTECSQ